MSKSYEQLQEEIESLKAEAREARRQEAARDRKWQAEVERCIGKMFLMASETPWHELDATLVEEFARGHASEFSGLRSVDGRSHKVAAVEFKKVSSARRRKGGGVSLESADGNPQDE